MKNVSFINIYVYQLVTHVPVFLFSIEVHFYLCFFILLRSLTCNSNNKSMAWPCHLDDITINWNLPSTFKKAIAHTNKDKKAMIERVKTCSMIKNVFFSSLVANHFFFVFVGVIQSAIKSSRFWFLQRENFWITFFSLN